MGLLRSVAFALFSLLIVAWCVGNISTYFLGTGPDAQVAQFLDAVGHTISDHNVTESALDDMTRSYWGAKRNSMKVHVVVTAVWALSSLVQHWTGSVHGVGRAHSIFGTVFLVCTALMSVFGSLLVRDQKIGINVGIAETITLCATLLFCLKGYVDMKRGRIISHRTSMTLSSMGLYYFLVQRVVIILMHFVLDDPGRSNLYYREVLWGSSAWLAFVITYGYGLWLAFGASKTEK